VTTNEYTKIVSPQERINIEGVSLLPPQGEGWVFKKKHAGSIEFGKLGGTKDQSLVALSVLSKLTEVESKEEFLALISKQRSRKQPDPRFENILNKEILSDEREGFCMRFHTIYKDYGAKNLSKKSDYLIVEDIGITCRHPYNKNIAVSIGFSQRTNPNNKIKNFELIANEFIKNAMLVPFTKTNTEIGYDYLKKKKYEQATEHYNLAIIENPNNYSAYFFRAICYSKQEQLSHAISDWKKVISLKADYLQAYSNIAASYKQMKDYKKALLYVNKAIKMASDLSIEQQYEKEIPLAYKMRGEINYELKNYQQIIQDYKYLTSINYENWIIYNNLVSIILEHSAKVDKSECVAYLEKAEKFTPEKYLANLYVTYGDLFSKIGEKNKALDFYNKAILRTNDPMFEKEIQKEISKLGVKKSL
jgi:tetratricopeptide (TPR) repeat protein